MSVDLRWEWRTFGDSFDVIKERLSQKVSETHESNDLYIVSRLTDANTKIRGSMLDIKVLQQIDPHGLELWCPTVKADFPITADAVNAALRLWGLHRVAPERESWTVQSFLTRFVSPEPALQAVMVAKRRRTFDVDGCVVELAELTVDGLALRTAAVEMTDAARVWRTVQAFGLSEEKNVNYVNALKAHLAAHPHPT